MIDSHTSTNTEGIPKQSVASRGESRSRRPDSGVFRGSVDSSRDPRITKEVERCGAADYLPRRAVKAGESFAGERLVIPAGTCKVRNNDCIHRFRTYSAFTHLLGLGDERGPDSVLVLESKEDGSHETVLYFKSCTSRSVQGFYSDPQCGEFWVGTYPSLEEVHQEMGLRCAYIDALPDALAKNAGRVKLRIVRGVDASAETIVNKIHGQAELPFGEEARSVDEAFEEHLSGVRLRKNAFEPAELARAIEVTRAGFEDIVRVLP